MLPEQRQLRLRLISLRTGCPISLRSSASFVSVAIDVELQSAELGRGLGEAHGRSLFCQRRWPAAPPIKRLCPSPPVASVPRLYSRATMIRQPAITTKISISSSSLPARVMAIEDFKAGPATWLKVRVP